MTKEEYIKYRDSQEVPIELYYEYYIENKHTNTEIIKKEDFKQIFETFLVHCNGKTILTNAGMKYIGMDRILTKIFDHFNKKFEL